MKTFGGADKPVGVASYPPHLPHMYEYYKILQTERTNRMRKKRNRAQEPEAEKPSLLARAFDMPEGVFSDFSQISLSSNREAVVEGCGGVLEYDSSLIRLNLNQMMVQFTGRNLEIKCMTGESVIVQGFILGIEFIV